MTAEHYFSAEPAGEQKILPAVFQVAGKTFELQSSSGTFSKGKLDAGTAVLLKLSDQFPTAGAVLDLGCGWGAIGITIAALQPATSVIGVDVNSRSLELANSNAARLGLSNFQAIKNEQLPESHQFDAIWSNPPIRIGKQQLHELLSWSLAKLKPTGEAYLVVQKQLGADSLQRWLQSEHPNRKVERVATDKGYRVLRVSAATHH